MISAVLEPIYLRMNRTVEHAAMFAQAHALREYASIAVTPDAHPRRQPAAVLRIASRQAASVAVA